MAISTESSPLRLSPSGVYTLWGYPVPPNVFEVDVSYDLYGDRRIRWVTTDSSTVHKMTLSVITDETILAVLAAMRLSC
jgi:hypothetical protein